MAPTTLAASCKQVAAALQHDVGNRRLRRPSAAGQKLRARPAGPARAAPASNSSAVDSPELLSEAERFVLELSGEELAAAAAPDALPAELEAQLSGLRSQVSVRLGIGPSECCSTASNRKHVRPSAVPPAGFGAGPPSGRALQPGVCGRAAARRARPCCVGGATAPAGGSAARPVDPG